MTSRIARPGVAEVWNYFRLPTTAPIDTPMSPKTITITKSNIHATKRAGIQPSPNPRKKPNCPMA